MEPFYNWRDGTVYAVFIYGGHYIVVSAWFQRFEDVVNEVRQYCVDNYQVKEPTPLIVLTSTFMDEKQASMLEDEELVQIVIGR